MLLLVLVATACMNDDEETPAPAPPTITQTPSNTPRPGSTIISFIPVTSTFTPTPVTPSVTPTPSDTPTATLAFEIDDYIGDWSVSVEYDFANAPGIDDVDIWVYRSLNTLRIDDSGEGIGRGDFTITADDLNCTLNVIEVDLSFFLIATLRETEDATVMEIEIEPDDPEVIEQFTILCLGEDETRDVETTTLWPAILNNDAFLFSLAVSEDETSIIRTVELDDARSFDVTLELLR